MAKRARESNIEGQPELNTPVILSADKRLQIRLLRNLKREPKAEK
jgi:hypothetical protein